MLHAHPELVVASAGKPRPASRRALPASHGLGMTKQPVWCRRRKVSMRAFMDAGRLKAAPTTVNSPLEAALRRRRRRRVHAAPQVHRAELVTAARLEVEEQL